MHLTRIMAAAALAAGIGITATHAAQASVTATIRIDNNATTAIYHAKNPPGTAVDIFFGVAGWTVAPPDSLGAGANDSSTKITLGANEKVTFTYGTPNSANPFSSSCTFSIQANSFGSALKTPVASRVGMASCTATLPAGKPYNVELGVSGL
ncbi:MAG: hypothetical protein NVS3B7_04140 [Candidatus Elarobacter sp.]